MSVQRDAEWATFDALGIEEIRKRLGASQYSVQTAAMAREWLAHHESLRSDTANAASLAEARAANELARSANELAERANAAALEANDVASAAAASAALSVAAARTNNIIATAALVAAIIAIVISIIGLTRTVPHGKIQTTETQSQTK